MRRLAHALRALMPMLILVLASGCAYFNGVYNARHEEKAGDKAMRRPGGDGSAYFATSAMKAESVLVRYPKSRWADDALYLAARGWAYAGQCEQALPKLIRFLALPGQAPERRQRASLAMGMCLVRTGRPADGRDLLVPLTRAPDAWMANDASLWAARASMALGENDSALVYLRGAGESSAEWELASSYLGRLQFAQAESLLASRARRGDYRPQLLPALALFWDNGQPEAVDRLVRLYDRSRLGAGERARLHLAIGELHLRSGIDSLARAHFELSQRLSRDTLTERDANARLLVLSMDGVDSVGQVEKLLKDNQRALGATPQYRRLDDNLLLIQVLLDRTDYTGSSLFLAAEVARDSLRSRTLAHALFKRLLSTLPNVPVAPKALLAAAAAMPDSAEAYNARLREEYPNSPYTLAVDRRDNPLLSTTPHADVLLQQAWTQMRPLLSAALAKRKLERGETVPPPSGSGSNPQPGGTRPP